MVTTDSSFKNNKHLDSGLYSYLIKWSSYTLYLPTKKVYECSETYRAYIDN